MSGLELIIGAGTAAERAMLVWDRVNRNNGLRLLEIPHSDRTAAAELAPAVGCEKARASSCNAVRAGRWHPKPFGMS